MGAYGLWQGPYDRHYSEPENAINLRVREQVRDAAVAVGAPGAGAVRSHQATSKRAGALNPTRAHRAPIRGSSW